MDAYTTITTHHNVSQRGSQAPAAPSTWVSMEDDERVDDVDGIPEPLKQMTLGGPFTRRFRFFERPMKAGWWFQIFFIFTPIWGRFPFQRG